MINKIYSSHFASSNNSNMKTNQSKVSFGKAYPLIGKYNDVFSPEIEQNFILELTKLTEKAMKEKTEGSKILKYLNSDGITHRFKTQSGEILYTPSKRGLMSNLKYVTDKDPKRGFYIIDDVPAKNEEQGYLKLSKLLNSLIKGHKDNISYFRNSNSQERKWSNSVGNSARKIG